MTNRIVHIDNAKAIGIMLIAMSHLWVTENFACSTFYSTWNGFINSFYVPLFFILSGVFESSDTSLSKFRQRMLKLAKFIGIFYLYGIITAGLILGKWSLGDIAGKTTIWFLITLVWMTLFMYPIKKLKCGWLFLIPLVGGGIYLSSHGKSLFYVGQASLSLPFYALGFYLRRLLKDDTFAWWRVLSYFSIWVALFIFFYMPQNLSINHVEQNFLAFYAEAICGSLFMMEISKLIRWNVIAYYGRNSIVPMLTQLSIVWLMCNQARIDSIIHYIIYSLVLIIIAGFSILLFRNNKYDLFK